MSAPRAVPPGRVMATRLVAKRPATAAKEGGGCSPPPSPDGSTTPPRRRAEETAEGRRGVVAAGPRSVAGAQSTLPATCRAAEVMAASTSPLVAAVRVRGVMGAAMRERRRAATDNHLSECRGSTASGNDDRNAGSAAGCATRLALSSSACSASSAAFNFRSNATSADRAAGDTVASLVAATPAAPPKFVVARRLWKMLPGMAAVASDGVWLMDAGSVEGCRGAPPTTCRVRACTSDRTSTAAVASPRYRAPRTRCVKTMAGVQRVATAQAWLPG